MERESVVAWGHLAVGVAARWEVKGQLVVNNFLAWHELIRRLDTKAADLQIAVARRHSVWLVVEEEVIS